LATNHGYKVTDVIVNGISMASAQHSDLVSVIQRNNGHMSALLVALREKNASNGISDISRIRCCTRLRLTIRP
jgi:hypothetical protein